MCSGFSPIRDAWLARAAGLADAHPRAAGGQRESACSKAWMQAGALILRETPASARLSPPAKYSSGDPMLLAIDAGNTNIVFAVCDGDDVRAEWRAVTKTTRTADEYAVHAEAAAGARRAVASADLDAAIIATVVPAALFDLRQFCRKYLKCEPLVVGDPNVDLGIGIKVDRPAPSAPTAWSIPSPRMSLQGRGDRGRFRHRHHFRHCCARMATTKAA